MARAWSVCSQRGCPTPTPPGQSRCEQHAREADRARGTAAERGYAGRGHEGFRDAVLLRDPICVCVDGCSHHGATCLSLSTVADHWPRSRRELEQLGLNPNDPAHGRGLCKRCHDRSTARRQPGGWAAADVR